MENLVMRPMRIGLVAEYSKSICIGGFWPDSDFVDGSTITYFVPKSYWLRACCQGRLIILSTSSNFALFRAAAAGRAMSPKLLMAMMSLPLLLPLIVLFASFLFPLLLLSSHGGGSKRCQKPLSTSVFSLSKAVVATTSPAFLRIKKYLILAPNALSIAF